MVSEGRRLLGVPVKEGDDGDDPTRRTVGIRWEDSPSRVNRLATYVNKIDREWRSARRPGYTAGACSPFPRVRKSLHMIAFVLA